MADRPGAGEGRAEEQDHVAEIYLAASDLPLDERASYLDEACGGRPGLRRDVQELLDLAAARPDLLIPPEIGLIPPSLGPYEVVRELGRGGMGIVLEARDARLLRTVALKVLPRYLSADDRSRQRFRREARILARLKHPNIATLYSLEEHAGRDLLVMEYVAGDTLAAILGRRSLTRDQAVSLAWQVVSALEAAHGMGICHCDLKPANIMLAADGRVSVLDFGIARAFGQVLQEVDPPAADAAGLTVAAGTPGYMAPEQAAGGPVDQCSDLWALGAILFECLTGRRYAPPEADGATARKKLLPPGVPRPLAHLVADCLEPDPVRRLATAAQARRRLERLLHRRRAGLRAASLLLAVVAGAAGALWGLRAGGPSGPLHEVRVVDAHTVEASNPDAETLWSRRFVEAVRAAVVPTRIDPGTGRPDRSRPLGTALALRDGEGAGYLAMLDVSGERELWRCSPRWPEPVNGRGSFYYRWLEATPWPGREATVLLGAVRDGVWYAMGIEAVAADGRLLGVYCHPGPLSISPGSLTARGERAGIIMFGTNSSARFDRRLVPFSTEHHPGCLVRLDPGRVDGQAYPYSAGLPEERDWPGMPRARERAYLLIPMLHPSHGARVDHFLWQDEDAGGGCNIYTEDGRCVILDEDFRPREAVITLRSFADSLYQAGGAHNPPYLYIRDGVRHWIDVPLGY